MLKYRTFPGFCCFLSSQEVASQFIQMTVLFGYREIPTNEISKKKNFMALTDTDAAAGDAALGRLLGQDARIVVKNDEMYKGDYRQKVLALYLEYDGYLQECGLTDDQVELLARLHDEFRELTVPKHLLSHLIRHRLLGN